MAELFAEAATAMDVGRRDRQEDAVIASFPQGGDLGIAVLSDGMGGHSFGDVASRIIVSETFGELFFSSVEPEHLRRNASQVLHGAVKAANQCLKAQAQGQGGRHVMGGTVIAAMVMDDGLRWISVGDSPLFLFRDGGLRRLNQDHSMAPRIDFMAREGLIDAETARNHPQRHCLTSALTGEAIDQIDCPEAPLALQADDVVILSSDGIQVLEEDQIGETVARHHGEGCRAIAQALLSEVSACGNPHQDNVSLVVLKTERLRAANAPVIDRVAPAAPMQRLFAPLLRWRAT